MPKPTLELTSEIIRTSLEAIKSIREPLESGSPEAMATCRRIASSLRHTDNANMRSSANAILKASPDQFKKPLAKFLKTLNVLAAELPDACGTPKEGCTILIVEDDPDIKALLMTELAGTRREIITASTITGARALLEVNEVSLVLLDLLLPDGDGRELLLDLRNRGLTSRRPVVVLSSKSEPSVQAECYALGAINFFAKPVEGDVIGAAVAAYLQRASEERKEAREDSLTGLPNRAAFSETFEREKAHSRRNQTSLSVGVLDIDRFKSVNDTYGHQVGDDVLQHFAEMISGGLRESDLIARWGGEEFAILFPNTDVDGAQLALQNILNRMRTEEFTVADGSPLKITFSAGITSVNKKTTLDEAIAEADRYMYLAKTAGRNRIFTSENVAEPDKELALIYQEDENLAILLEGVLLHDGFESMIVNDKIKALDQVKKNPPSLILIDSAFKKSDDFKLITDCRALAKTDEIGIVAFTPEHDDRMIQSVLASGADECILTPFSVTEAVARIRRLVRRRGLELEEKLPSDSDG